jgi:hypothetical protein
MNTSNAAPRRPRKISLQTEGLEARALMTSGAGNTFAIMKSSIDAAKAMAVIPFTIDSTHFTLNNRGKLMIGVDVAAQTGSTILPHVVAVEDMQTHRMIPVSHAIYTKSVQRATPGEGSQTTAAIATLTPWKKGSAGGSHDYAAIVSGLKNTTGALLVGFYLPGDANGDGVVNNTDIGLIKGTLGANANASTYNFAYDTNRGGVIDGADLNLAKQNLGASTTITPVVAANLDAASDSGLQDRITNIQVVQFDGTASPGAAITYSEINGNAPTATTNADINGNYILHVTLGNGDNTFNVSAKDSFGQTVSGEISPVTYSVNAAPNV